MKKYEYILWGTSHWFTNLKKAKKFARTNEASQGPHDQYNPTVHVYMKGENGRKLGKYIYRYSERSKRYGWQWDSAGEDA